MKANFFDHNSLLCDFEFSESQKRQAEVWRILKKIERVAPVVWLTDALCIDGVCRVSFDDVLVYRDADHFSREGSAFIGKRMDFYRLLENAGASAF